MPLEFYAAVAEYLKQGTGLSTALRSITDRSGPDGSPNDPFVEGEADVGFMCATGYTWLNRHGMAELACAAVHVDPQAGGRPVYFSTVIARAENSASSLLELRGSRWCFNEPTSLSGHRAVTEHLRANGASMDMFGEVEQSGSHIASVQRVVDGKSDAAAIDSTVLWRLLHEHPELRPRLHVVEQLGPFAAPPVVTRRGLDPKQRELITEVLLAMHEREQGVAILGVHHYSRFARVEHGDYVTA
ncbi:PhnD/SsuA/transferrin family substrate-binding protein [Desulfobulbus sp. AH-315-M07]|nr:PhnD/SsuA/transferrin family substrate-binding protein [Desulfobulbus sp. AH-315-M07]